MAWSKLSVIRRGASSSCDLGTKSMSRSLCLLYNSGSYDVGPPMTVSVRSRTTSATVLSGVSGVPGGFISDINLASRHGALLYDDKITLVVDRRDIFAELKNF